VILVIEHSHNGQDWHINVEGDRVLRSMVGRDNLVAWMGFIDILRNKIDERADLPFIHYRLVGVNGGKVQVIH
jgi:hypothetical protein